MAKGLPSINLHLAAAQSCFTVVRTLLKEKLHEDDRKKEDELLLRAEDALDKASALLGNLRSRLDDIGDQL